MTDRSPRVVIPQPLGAFAIVFFLISALSVWGAPLDRVLNRGGYTPAESSEIRAILEQAERDGIPESMLFSRVEEAAAKKIPADRLITALRAEIRRLEHARRLLGDAPEALVVQSVWQRTANLLLWGATDAEIRGLVTAVEDRPARYAGVTALFVALADWGLSRDQALELCRIAAHSPLDDREVAGVTRLLAGARRRREPPGAVADRLIRALPGATSLQHLEDQIKYE